MVISEWENLFIENLVLEIGRVRKRMMILLNAGSAGIGTTQL